MNWVESRENPKVLPREEQETSRIPEGMWTKCPECKEILQTKLLIENLRVCSHCQYHFRISVEERIAHLTDKFEERDVDLRSTDPLMFTDSKPYRERLDATKKKTGRTDAFRYGKAWLFDRPISLGAFDFHFMGGSMGAVVGEKVARVFEISLKERIPAVVINASGGARMQEGIVSLMQMAKTSRLIADLRAQGIPYISVLSDPTTGGVAASFAMLGDIIIAEPKALIGFAGPRVIEQTIRQKLPEGFQRSEFLVDHGFVDFICHRGRLKNTLGQVLSYWK